METFAISFFFKTDEIVSGRFRISSPTFRTTYKGVSFWWVISLHPNGSLNDGSSEMCLRLVNTEKGYEENLIKTRLAFYSFNTSGRTRSVQTSYVGFSLRKLSDLVGRVWAFRNFPIRQRFDKRIPSDLKIFSTNRIKIVCKLMIKRESFEKITKPTVIYRCVKDDKFSVPALTERLFERILSSSNSDELSDITLVSLNGRRFYCHRYVLFANSDVFATMFSNSNFVENSSRLVEIDDVDSETLTELLRYMYTGKFATKFGAKLAVKCLYAAEKYNVQPLKSFCVSNMKFKLDETNVLEYLHLADKYSLRSLLALCIDFLTSCIESIHDIEWNSFCRQHSALVGQVFKTLCHKTADVNCEMALFH